MKTRQHIRSHPSGARVKNPVDDEGYKVCNKCGEKKLAEEGFKYDEKKLTWASWCIECGKEYQRHMRKTRYTKVINGIKIDDYRYQKLYGLTAEDIYDKMADQDMKCAICEQPPNGRYKKLHLDHSHETGKPRGMLCDSCNRMLGLAKDSTQLLNKAIQYLTDY